MNKLELNTKIIKDKVFVFKDISVIKFIIGYGAYGIFHTDIIIHFYTQVNNFVQIIYEFVQNG